MEWRGRRGSGNIEDRRGVSGARAGSVGGLGVIAVLVIGYFLGIDVTPLLNNPGAGPSGPAVEMTAEDKAAGEFVSVVLADTEEIWAGLFQTQLGRAYDPATLVLYKGEVCLGGGVIASARATHEPASGQRQDRAPAQQA